MKFRIKTFNDLKNETVQYSPECKRHWYTSWESIVPGYYKSYILSDSTSEYYNTIQEAQNVCKIYANSNVNKTPIVTYTDYRL